MTVSSPRLLRSKAISHARPRHRHHIHTGATIVAARQRPSTSARRRPAAPTPVRGIATTAVRGSLLGLDRTAHWSKPTTLPRGPTIAELALRRRLAREDPSRLKVFPCPVRSARAACRDPLAAVTRAQLAVLDPTGARERLFARTNLEGAKVGDILLVRTAEGDPVSGVCIDIRRRGVHTTILLRNNLTRVGVEMWIKIYSPNVLGIEVVQRRAKRARRARLYYMRQPKHDIGSVQNVVQQYVRQQQMLRSGGSDKSSAGGGKGKRNKRK